MATAGQTRRPTGKDGCQCTDESSVLASLTERSCQTLDGESGGVLTATGLCVPYSYGSGGCLRHDLIHDPACDKTDLGKPSTPDYCPRSWCYVDSVTCRQSSSERVYRSTYFNREEGVDLFYSYTTCDSSAGDGKDYQAPIALGSTTIEAIIPIYQVPYMYKNGPDGAPLSMPGSEYYDSSVPYEGILMNYFNSLMEISEGRLNISYTFASEAGKLVHPSSKFTAAVQDVSDGLADMAAGPFWISSQRLQLTSFTVPLYYEKTTLVIPNPGTGSSLSAQVSKVLEPFSVTVWFSIIALITVTSCLSVWFSNKSASEETAMTRSGRRPSIGSHRTKRPAKSVYARLCLDACLEKGGYFFSAGVDQDSGASLPHKILMFGFGFFILIVVSAYVANLAAFLTWSMPEFVGTMEGAVANDLIVCAHPVLEKEFKAAWPNAKFLFHQGGNDFKGMLDDYDDGNCNVIAASKLDIDLDLPLSHDFCERNLVFSDSLVLENPVALPIRPELSRKLSYWMYHAEKAHGITFLSTKEEYDANQQPPCNLKFTAEQNEEADDMAQIGIENLFFPFVFFLGAAVLAIILQLLHQQAMRKGRFATLVGRRSTFNLMGLIDLSSKADDSMEEDDAVDQLAHTDTPQSNGVAVSLVKGSIVSDAEVHIDEFHTNGHTRDGSTSLHINATSRLQLLAETDTYNEILDCLHAIKRQKESGSFRER